MKRIDIIGMNGNDGLHYKKVTTMDIQQLQRFIDAFKTGNFSNFHGDTQEFTVELAEEVMRLNENLMGLPKNPKIDEVFDFWEEHHSEDDDDVSPLDTQVGGDHYKDQKIQPVEYIHANKIGYFEGNVIKYVSRWKNKNGITDLEKAKHYLELLIELEQKKCLK